MSDSCILSLDSVSGRRLTTTILLREVFYSLDLSYDDDARSV